MSAEAAARAPERMRFPDVRAPEPRLPAEAERRLTARQREILQQLEQILGRAGFGRLTMADLAAQTGCSLRTLYGIAPSKEELVLIVVDRRLRRIGRAALEPLRESMPGLEALRLYLRAAHQAVRPTTASYARELADAPGVLPLIDAHEGYVIAVTRSLLDRSVRQGEIGPVDTAAVAQLLGGLGRQLAGPAPRRLRRGALPRHGRHPGRDRPARARATLGRRLHRRPTPSSVFSRLDSPGRSR